MGSIFNCPRSKQTYMRTSYFKCPNLKFSEFQVKMSTRKCQLARLPGLEPTEVKFERKYQKMVTVQFQNLPDEIILKVMSNLTIEELIQWCQVTRELETSAMIFHCGKRLIFMKKKCLLIL